MGGSFQRDSLAVGLTAASIFVVTTLVVPARLYIDRFEVREPHLPLPTDVFLFKGEKQPSLGKPTNYGFFALQWSIISAMPLSGVDFMPNAMMVIFPYRFQGTWLFDDESVGLIREPFVSGIPEMIDILVQNIPYADKGFRLLFSEKPFPGYQTELIWVKQEYGGNWYRWQENNREGWLCPAMFKYFTAAPKKIYCKAEKLLR